MEARTGTLLSPTLLFRGRHRLSGLMTRQCCWFSESQLKDNPAFSMLNDSDDDVIYG